MKTRLFFMQPIKFFILCGGRSYSRINAGWLCFAVALAISIVLVSCSDEQRFVRPSDENTRQNAVTASQGYIWKASDKQFLDKLYEEYPDNVIHYRVARCLVYAELMGATGSLFDIYNLYASENDGVYLTAFPRVIFGMDGYPKYYEFTLKKREIS